jgi:hypothetical protein
VVFRIAAIVGQNSSLPHRQHVKTDPDHPR